MIRPAPSSTCNESEKEVAYRSRQLPSWPYRIAWGPAMGGGPSRSTFHGEWHAADSRKKHATLVEERLFGITKIAPPPMVTGPLSSQAYTSQRTLIGAYGGVSFREQKSPTSQGQRSVFLAERLRINLSITYSLNKSYLYTNIINNFNLNIKFFHRRGPFNCAA
jgi:hypothetical protein